MLYYFGIRKSKGNKMAVAGRPRTFNKSEALTKAMYIFWEKGYEGTTMADLINAIGMKAPSLYAAFGNKDSIFKEVVSNYMPIVVNGQLKVLNTTPIITLAVEGALQECIKLFSSNENPNTCLVITSAINTSPEHSEHGEHLKELRIAYKQVWVDRFIKAKHDNQLSEAADPAILAEYFTTLIQGMALKAKDGASKQSLEETAKLALTCMYGYYRSSTS